MSNEQPLPDEIAEIEALIKHDQTALSARCKGKDFALRLRHRETLLTALRQQRAEIERLKELLAEHHTEHCQSQSRIRPRRRAWVDGAV